MSRSNSVKIREQLPLGYQQNYSNLYIQPNQIEDASIRSNNASSPKGFVNKLSPKNPYLNNNNTNSNNYAKSSTIGNDLNSSYRQMYLAGSNSKQQGQSQMSQSLSPGNTARFQQNQAQLNRNQRGNSVSKAVSSAATGNSNSNRNIDENLKNKENFNTSLTKIFFNSPRCGPNTSGMEQNQQIDAQNSSHQYISVLKPSNHESDKKRQSSIENSMASSKIKSMKNSQINQACASITSSQKKLAINNNYSNIKQSLVKTKNINLKESNNNLDLSQTSNRSIRINEFDSKTNSQQTIQPLTQSKNTINLTANRPASTSQMERSSKLNNSSQKALSIQKSKEERSKVSSVQSSRKSFENTAQKKKTTNQNQ